MFEVIVGAIAVIAGIMAGISGAGIGSVLTPLLSFQIDIKLAIAAVAIPHLCGSVMRLLLMWRSVDHRVFLNFGILSAAGGLVGAWIHSFLSNYILTLLFAILLILAGLTGVFGLTERLKFGRWTGWVAGAISGFLGGMVGEQGGFRSAALLGFDVKKDALHRYSDGDRPDSGRFQNARLPLHAMGQARLSLGSHHRGGRRRDYRDALRAASTSLDPGRQVSQGRFRHHHRAWHPHAF